MKVIIFVFLLIVSLNAISGASYDHPYYPSNFAQTIWAMSVKNNEMKKMVQEVLTKAHLEREGKADTLVDKCQEGQICNKRRILQYSEARAYLFGKLHLHKDNHGYYIKDVYCNKTFDSHTPHIKDVGPMRIPNADVLNCEHTWPQSRFSTTFSAEEQKSDLHHLFPSENTANSIRGNYQFGEVSEPAEVNLCDTSTFGVYQSRKSRDFTAFFFAPPMEHRGNVARALFYFSIKYDLRISPDEEFYLRKWHIQDPVDDEELQRNDEIYEIQFNRNPFIDYPFIVDLINDF